MTIMYVLSVTTKLAMVLVVAKGFGVREDAMSVFWNADLNPEELLSCLMELKKLYFNSWLLRKVSAFHF